MELIEQQIFCDSFINLVLGIKTYHLRNNAIQNSCDNLIQELRLEIAGKRSRASEEELLLISCKNNIREN
jgi:hypothetical protein